MQTQAMTNKIYTADRDRDFHFRVKDPGSAATHFIGFVAAVLMTPVLSYDDFCIDRRFLYTGLPDRIASRCGDAAVGNRMGVSYCRDDF